MAQICFKIPRLHRLPIFRTVCPRLTQHKISDKVNRILKTQQPEPLANLSFAQPCCSYGTGNILAPLEETESTRSFHTGYPLFKKCKKDKKKKKGCKKKQKDKGSVCKMNKGPCPNIKMKNCKPTSSKLCDFTNPWPKCGRQCAPYPSYSELCHKNVELPPSECHMCPWPKEKHPTYKDKKEFHTLTGIQQKSILPGFCWQKFVRNMGKGKCEDKDEKDCGKVLKKCKKKDKFEDKCGAECKPKKCDKNKGKEKKRDCSFKWQQTPCEKKPVESKKCPKDLIKKPKCP